MRESWQDEEKEGTSSRGPVSLTRGWGKNSPLLPGGPGPLIPPGWVGGVWACALQSLELCYVFRVAPSGAGLLSRPAQSFPGPQGSPCEGESLQVGDQKPLCPQAEPHPLVSVSTGTSCPPPIDCSYYRSQNCSVREEQLHLAPESKKGGRDAS